MKSHSLIEKIRIREEISRRYNYNALSRYKPYPKQIEFHKAGALHHERLLCAGNQCGKSLSAAAEMAIHLTGRYPDWWEGATFNKPITMWASGVTGESTRDNPQRLLVGPPAVKTDWGVGMIPGECLIETNLAMGIKNALDSVVVRWGGGGDIQSKHSILGFKSYEKGRERWQGPSLDIVAFDEEPPMDIYQEGKTRTQNGQNSIFTMVTFTPLKGMSSVVRMFLQDETKE